MDNYISFRYKLLIVFLSYPGGILIADIFHTCIKHMMGTSVAFTFNYINPCFVIQITDNVLPHTRSRNWRSQAK